MVTIDRPRALAALERFVERAAGDRRARATAGLVRDTEAAMNRALGQQGREFRRGLEGLKGMWQEPDLRPMPGDWLPYFDVAANATRERMQAGLYYNMLEALVMGGGHLVEDIGVPLTIAFNLENPLAVAYAASHAARQVTRINDTTRAGINRIIMAAVDNGTSYTRVAAQLREAYEFSAGRARRIAVYEMGAAYEQGKKMAADQMELQGLRMEKGWQSAEDSRVRPAHRENQGAGWVAMDAPFPSGDELPPSDSGCRCTILWRVAKGR